MGGELEKYLDEAEGKEKEEKEKKEAGPTALQRLKAEFLGPPKPKRPKVKKQKIPPIKDSSNKGKAKSTVKAEMFTAFKNFKKAHGMIMW